MALGTSFVLGKTFCRLHPGLLGKRKSKTSDDSLSKSLRESAERVKMLEEETIVQLDPLRGEKEMLFAQGYLKRYNLKKKRFVQSYIHVI